MLFRIGLFCLFCFSIFGAEHVYLKTPRIDRAEIVGINVGIRPFRKDGVRLEAERLRNKLVIHNYGYGGSGLTLSFGGAEEVLKILQREKNSARVVAVLGAGVTGLATAYDLLEKGYEVHLYADQWSPNVTSNVAAGSWTPHFFTDEDPLEIKQFHQLLLESSEKRFLKSACQNPEFAGVRFIHSYRLLTAQEEVKGGEEVVVHFDNGVSKRARRKKVLGLDGKLFMEDLFAKVKSKGAKLKQKRFKSLDEILSLSEKVIVNCMSLGSRELFGDRTFVPERGQVVYFPAQEMDYSLYQIFPDSPYFFMLYPWSDRIILGGVHELGEEELKIDPKVTEEMIRNAESCLRP